MSEKIGFADAVRAGGDKWRLRGVLDGGGMGNRRAAALFMAEERPNADFSAYMLMVEAQEYRLCRNDSAPFAMPCLEKYRYRMGAVA